MAIEAGIQLRVIGAHAQITLDRQQTPAMPALLQQLWACPKPVLAAGDGKVRAGGIGCSPHVTSPWRPQ